LRPHSGEGSRHEGSAPDPRPTTARATTSVPIHTECLIKPILPQVDYSRFGAGAGAAGAPDGTGPAVIVAVTQLPF
jgi:hypothetical protein